jgi:RNA polymerase sigma-70 factor (ECF subfamily)
MNDFTRDTEAFRRELLAHCYRMLGSAHDAEDVVQETYLRAWRSYGGFENRASVRTWLYRIATNASLTALARSSQRVLPSGLGAPSGDPHAAPIAVDAAWIEPIPDAVVTSDDPADVIASRASMRLALIASLQHLPAQQRAVVLLRDVLAFPAVEVAEMLEISVPAVKSALQRARSRLKEVAPSADDVIEPADPRARALLDSYISAFENADADALAAVLREDAALEMVGSRTWFSGRATCLPYIATHVLGARGDWRMVPVEANGQSAAAAYHRDTDGVLRAFGIALLDLTVTGIFRIVVYGDAGLVTHFGLPMLLPSAEIAKLRAGGSPVRTPEPLGAAPPFAPTIRARSPESSPSPG